MKLTIHLQITVKPETNYFNEFLKIGHEFSVYARNRNYRHETDSRQLAAVEVRSSATVAHNSSLGWNSRCPLLFCPSAFTSLRDAADSTHHVTWCRQDDAHDSEWRRIVTLADARLWTRHVAAVAAAAAAAAVNRSAIDPTNDTRHWRHFGIGLHLVLALCAGRAAAAAADNSSARRRRAVCD